MQCADSLRTQAYFDGEIDVMSAAEVERHAETCADCRALLQDLQRSRTAIRALGSVRAPPELRTQIMRALDQETATVRPMPAARRPPWRVRPFWAGAFGGIGGTALAATLAFFVFAPSIGNALLDELVAAHVRSLMPSHLIDVVSTDQHTVKPWFAGHTDVSPAVADFAQQGYRLVGGRADYLEHQRAAVVVYEHGPHVINVFSWATRQGITKNTTRNGYRMAFWTAGDLQYCAVSDTGWDELLGLVHLQQNLNTQDSRG
jgi:anti-sigma factor RsiW